MAKFSEVCGLDAAPPQKATLTKVSAKWLGVGLVSISMMLSDPFKRPRTEPTSSGGGPTKRARAANTMRDGDYANPAKVNKLTVPQLKEYLEVLLYESFWCFVVDTDICSQKRSSSPSLLGRPPLSSWFSIRLVNNSLILADYRTTVICMFIEVFPVAANLLFVDLSTYTDGHMSLLHLMQTTKQEA